MEEEPVDSTSAFTVVIFGGWTGDAFMDIAEAIDEDWGETRRTLETERDSWVIVAILLCYLYAIIMSIYVLGVMPAQFALPIRHESRQVVTQILSF